MGEEKESQRQLNITLLLQKGKQCKVWKVHEHAHSPATGQFLSQRVFTWWFKATLGSSLGISLGLLLLSFVDCHKKAYTRWLKKTSVYFLISRAWKSKMSPGIEWILGEDSTPDHVLPWLAFLCFVERGEKGKTRKRTILSISSFFIRTRIPP